MKLNTQVCIVGAGAGGTGCVYRLIRKGIKTVVVDKNPDFGGTAVFCGVDGWEPGVSLPGIHELLKNELEKMDKGCHIVGVVPNLNIFDSSVGYDWTKHSFSERPWGYSVKTEDKYEDTLMRCSSLVKNSKNFRRFQFESDLMREAMNRVLNPYRNHLTSLFGHTYQSCTVEDGKIKSMIVSGPDGNVEIFADYFVDASGDIVLARDAGCDYSIGSEGREEFNEPSASKKCSAINGVTYVFRIQKTDDPEYIDEIPQELKDCCPKDWLENRMKKIVSCFVKYPNGDINVNMLPTMSGNEYLEYGENADKIGKAMVYVYWNYLQKEKKMTGYTIKQIFDAGIRESYRLRGRYILKEQDIRRGTPEINGRIVSIADHALDVHGNNGLTKEIVTPYEIPLECAMTKEFDNLFVACRGASFTHIAASTARLTRTMLSFGEGVGEYISELLSCKA